MVWIIAMESKFDDCCFSAGDESLSAKWHCRSACQSVSSPERLQSEGLLIIKKKKTWPTARRELVCLTLIKLILAPKLLAAESVGLLALGSAQGLVTCDCLLKKKKTLKGMSDLYWHYLAQLVQLDICLLLSKANVGLEPRETEEKLWILWWSMLFLMRAARWFMGDFVGGKILLSIYFPLLHE